ncbi:MAG TPA: metallophosphoesterase [Phycisphaerae bacterium]|nr:metallophosphoesterase [Phycisphaerae bacterium]
MYSILHISDLHRSDADPANNDSLIAALLDDHDRYRLEVPPVRSPDAIIVSGDLVQGVRIGTENFALQTRAQYEVAEQLLDVLCRRFIDGDRRRLILIPGNHDVCWNTARASMEELPVKEYPADIRGALLQQDSPYRWSWKDRKLYRVRDTITYNKRLDHYWDFVEGFYKDISLALPIDRSRGYQLFVVDNDRIVIAAFDSLTGNDCFGYSGAIQTGAVARCNIQLRDMEKHFSLKIAVWHHSIQGPPLREDYMDVRQVNEMAGLGFQLGLHGHQHIAATTTHYIHLNERRAMGVISGGSLCAGFNELPRGTNRQYNVIVIGDDYAKARLHVREMVEGEQFSSKRNGAFTEGYCDISWQPPRDTAGRIIDAAANANREIVLKAEAALRGGCPHDALALLQDASKPPASYARDIAIQAATQAKDWRELLRILRTPSTIDEHVLVVTALTQIGHLTAAEKALSVINGITESLRKELTDQIFLKRMMSNQ